MDCQNCVGKSVNMGRFFIFLLAVATALFLSFIFISAKNGALDGSPSVGTGHDSNIIIEDFDYPIDSPAEE